ncbi:MAG TPA: PQQ-binding-like beta-propeller repeat protein [Candidatus Eisenbacteria bacterium]|nr:PQQ-binding-like beta-propeller repeat protein [Candidatus Eisenbacteria bacterium]
MAVLKDSSTRAPFPKVTGYVYSMAGDGHGGWFLSGNFTAVGGVPRYCLAHVLSDGSVTEWNPNPNKTPYGTGGILVSGSTVYVGGGFATIGGKSRLYIAAIDAVTGEVLDWNAHANGIANPLAIHGRTIYVGGGFSQIGGLSRNNIAALDVKTGDAMAWNPDADGWVSGVALWGRRVYACGVFRHIGGQRRVALAELDPETGLATDWNPDVGPAGNSNLVTMSVRGDVLYVGGYCKSVSGMPRQSVAAFRLTTGRLDDWDPEPGFAPNNVPIVFTLASDGKSIYVGGQFDQIGGRTRHYAAELGMRTGSATDWNPDPNRIVYALGACDSLIYMGGEFKTVGAHRIHNIAALDLATGQAKDWNANMDGVEVTSLAVYGGRVYVGGAFRNAGGQPRSMLAALDTLTGAATDWNPGADDLVNTLFVRGDTVYVGGNFNHVGGQARNYLAALDATTGAALAWNPSPNDYVETLHGIGNTIYAGGWFTRMGGDYHYSAAAVDATTGAVLPWRANAKWVVSALTSIGNTVYMGGPFEQVNDQPRNGLAAVDGTTGALLPWNPDPSGPREDAYYTSINALAAHGNVVFVGGDFTRIGGQAHASLAAVDALTGAALDWDPAPDQSVWTLDASSDRLFAGGFFQAAELTPHLALMSVSYPALAVAQRAALNAASAISDVVTLGPAAPNPMGSNGTLHFSLPRAVPVSLFVYDLQGRRVAALISHEMQAPGEHAVPIRTEGWHEGAYFLRLEAGGITRTEKLIVLK